MKSVVPGIASTLLVIFSLAGNVATAPISAGDVAWHDRFYQYRIPITVNFEKAGWNLVPLNEEQITEAINRLEEMHYDPLWFAYNFQKVVEVDGTGRIVDPAPTIGFHLILQGEELIGEQALSGDQETVKVPVQAGSSYLLSYRAEGGGASPAQRYNPIFPIGSPRRNSANLVSYEPAMLPKTPTRHERLFISDGQPLELDVRTRWVKNISQMSLRKARVLLLANVAKTGKRSFHFYYQPNSGYYLDIPNLRHFNIPQATAAVLNSGPAEKLYGKAAYRVGANEHFDTWFAETTIKLTPNTPVPAQSAPAVEITTARNEAQSFQIVLRPKKSFQFKSVTASDLTSGNHSIPSANISLLGIDYVPISRTSELTSTRYLGLIGDPLTGLSSRRLSTANGNQALWVTVRTPPGIPAGVYQGALTIEYGGGVSSEGAYLDVPIRLKVHDFQLPGYSTFSSNLGGQSLSRRSGNRKDVLAYHGLESKDDLKKLSHKYYELMAANKFTPKTVAMYSEIGMKWLPPPQGYKLDAPGNYFKLYDWDFTEFNNDLRHYIDNLKVNMVTIEQTNPTVAHRFKQLPGLELKEFYRQPPHATMAWQTFRDATFVGYNKTDKDDFIEITRNQFDRLFLDYYRAIAENLEQNGWLDYAYILADETWNTERILHFLKLLKSDRLTARLKIYVCMQGFEYFGHKDRPEDTKYTFNGLVDIYMPQLDEIYNRWEKYYFTDHDITPARSKLWNYGVESSQLVIDTPGVNNRIIGLNVFNRGGSGFHVWETFWWDHSYGNSDNPWRDPYSTWGNGAVSYFYPPRKDGPSPEPDFSVIPSLRVMTYRESVDDYEYARILEDLVAKGTSRNVDVSPAKAVLGDIERFFLSSVLWSQNDVWYLNLRERMAAAIVDLQQRVRD